MAESWTSSNARIRPWTPSERAQRDRIIGALAEALTLPTRQVNYSRVAALLGITRPTVIEKLLHYQRPCPALVRTLTPSERERIAEIGKGCGDDPEHFRLAVVAFISEVWAIPRT